MTYPHDQDADKPILNVGDDPIVAHAIFPKFAEFCSFESLADRAGIIENRYALDKEFKDAPRSG